jgi:MFS family permease
LGAKWCVLFGFFLLTTTTFGLGLISNIKDTTTFEYAAIGIRFFQGSGDIILQVTCYSLVTSNFTEDLMKYISYIELTVGIGLSLGPALGSVVYPYL